MTSYLGLVSSVMSDTVVRRRDGRAMSTLCMLSEKLGQPRYQLADDDMSSQNLVSEEGGVEACEVRPP